MSERIKCPSCGAGLILSEMAGEWRATCPRCLAEIDVPMATPAPDAVQEQRPEPARGMRRPARIAAERVEAVWPRCPWCGELLRGQQSLRYGHVDLDVRRDTQRTSGFAIGLAIIGVVPASSSSSPIASWTGLLWSWPYSSHAAFAHLLPSFARAAG